MIIFILLNFDNLYFLYPSIYFASLMSDWPSSSRSLSSIYICMHIYIYINRERYTFVRNNKSRAFTDRNSIIFGIQHYNIRKRLSSIWKKVAHIQMDSPTSFALIILIRIFKGKSPVTCNLCYDRVSQFGAILILSKAITLTGLPFSVIYWRNIYSEIAFYITRRAMKTTIRIGPWIFW